MDTEKGISVQGRKRKSHNRRSSILKASKSPSRGALADLDPNCKEEADLTSDPKKQRRSRRVSFAETFTVKEFVKEVGFPAVPLHQDVEVAKADFEVEGINSVYKRPGSSGSLDTLLTAPFIGSETSTSGPVYQRPMPNVSDDSIQSNETHDGHHSAHNISAHVDSMSNQDQSDGRLDNADNTQTKIDSRSFLQSFSTKQNTEDKTQIFGQDNDQAMEMTLVQEKTIQLGVTEKSLQLSTQQASNTTMEFTKCVGQICVAPQQFDQDKPVLGSYDIYDKADSIHVDKTQIFGNDDSGNMELTGCFDLPVKSNESQNSSQKIDSLSFLTKISSGKPKMTDTSEPRLGTSAMLLNSDENNCKGLVESNSGQFKEDTPPTSGGLKIDSLSFLKKFKKALRPITPQPVTSVQSEATIHFGERNLGDDMEFTACHGSLVPLHESAGNAEDKTVHFSNKIEGNHGGMDMTECIGGLLDKTGEHVKQNVKDATITGADNDDNITMELTVCNEKSVLLDGTDNSMDTRKLLGDFTGLGKSKTTSSSEDTQKLLADISVVCKGPSEVSLSNVDATKRFDVGMEFTACQSGHITTGEAEDSMSTKNLLKGLSSINSPQMRDPSMDTRKLLSAGDNGLEMTKRFDGEGMDFTVCQDAPISLNNTESAVNTKHLLNSFSMGGLGSKSQLTNRSMDTQKLLAGATFCWRSATNNLENPKGSASVIMNETDKLLDGIAPNNKSSKSGFLEDTNKLLEQVPAVKHQNMSKSMTCGMLSKNDDADKARDVIDGDDGMEFTMCNRAIENIRALNDSCIPVRAESTRRIDVDINAGHMEFTKCIGSIEKDEGLGLRENIPTDDLVSQETDSNKLPDATVRFGGDDDGGMDFTTCNGNLMVYGQNEMNTDFTGVKPRQIEPSDNKAGEMEFTNCIGTVHLPSVCQLSNNNQTKMFDSEAGMEFTKCVGDILECPKENSNDSVISFKPNATRTVESTQIFGQEALAGMEFTTCVGKIDIETNYGGDDRESPAKTSLPESTKHFNSELTGGMELTKCVGHIEESDSQNAMSKSDSTKLFASETAGGMEFTKCEGLIIEDCRESEKQAAKSKCDSTKLFASEPTNDMEFTKCVGKIVENVEKVTTLQQDAKQQKKETGIEFTNCSDSRDHKDVSLVARNTGVKESVTVELSIAPVIPEPAPVAVKKDPCEGNDMDLLELQGGDLHKQPKESGILDEIEPLMMDLTHDTNPLVMADVSLNRDNLETYHQSTSDPKALSTSHIQMSEPKALSTSHVSMFDTKTLSTSRISMNDTKALSTSLMSVNKSVLGQASIMEKSLVMAPLNGPWSCSQFLEYVQIAFPTHNVASRRSTIAPVSVAPPDCLGDYLELACLVQPELHQHEWACDYLTSEIDRLKAAVVASETQISDHNPKILDMVKTYTDEELRKFEGEAKSLQQACRKLSKKTYKEWQAKLLKSILEAYREEESDLKKSIEQLDNANDTINKQLSQLDAVENELDKQIAEFEKLPMPSEGDLEAFTQANEQLIAKEKELEVLDKENNDLLREREALELEKDGMLCELKDIEQKLTEASCQQPQLNELEERYQTLERMQSYVAWRLVEYDDSHAKFHFLLDSLCMEVKFLDNDQAASQRSSKSVGDICLTSQLSDVAAPWAHLAHRMVLGAVDQSTLTVAYSTHQHIQQFLREVSKLAIDAQSLGEELEVLTLQHSVQVNGTQVMVEFSNLEAFSKFQVLFNLVPGHYPSSPLSCSCKVLIGDLSEEAIMEVMSSVSPGHLYIKRMVAAINNLLSEHAKGQS